MSFLKSFEVKGGMIVDEVAFYTGGNSSPVGLDYPIGTLYIQTGITGGVVVWRKYNTGVNDWIKAQPMDFYQRVEANAETSTTSTTTFLNKVTLTTPSLPLGDYNIEWALNWRAGANRAIDIRVQRAGANLINYQPFTPSAADRPREHSNLAVTNISGVQTFTLDFKVSGSGTTVYASLASLTFWRIA